MKNVLILIIALLVALSASGQSVDVDEGCLPLEVQFTGTPNLQDYFWSFGDGASSVAQDPMHTYITAGTYDAVLREGQNGPERGRFTITVYVIPQLAITVDQPDFCAPSDVTLGLNLSTNDDLSISGYEWSISGARDTTENPTFTFPTAGDYTVGVQVLSDLPGCNATLSEPNLINVQGTAALYHFVVDDPCTAPATASFTNTTVDLAGLTYLWEFGDGTTSTARDPQDVFYVAEGIYDVTLTVTSTDGCVSSNTQAVQIGQLDQLVTIPDTFCIGVSTLVPNQTAAASHLWFSGASAEISSTEKEPTFTFFTPGPQTIRYTSRFSGGCRTDSTYQIYVDDPQANLTVDPFNGCADPFEFEITSGTSFETYVWDGQVGVGNTTNIQYQVERDSQYLHQIDSIFVPFRGVTFSGCVVEDTTFAIQRRPNAELTVDKASGCAPLNIIFSDISTSWEDIRDYTWVFGDGATMTASDGANAQHTYTSPGIYNARLIIESVDGCRDTSNRLQIFVGEPITPDLDDYSFDICLGETISLETATNDPRIEAYQWTTDGGRQSDCWRDQTATVTFDKDPGTYDISLTTEYNGCRETVTRSGAVRVGGASAHVGYQTDCDSIYTVEFIDRGVGAVDRTWDFAGLGTSTELEPTFIFPDTGDYEVTLITSDPASGCPADTARQVIQIRDLIPVLTLPDFACDNMSAILKADLSQHVHNDCFRGYVWEMPNTRPRELPVDSITHLFTDPGSNTVRLTVRDVNGCTKTIQDTLEVYGIEPLFNVSDTSICLPAEVLVLNETTSDTTIVDWSWSFGSTNEVPGRIEITESDFLPFIRLTVEDVIGCTDSYAIPIERYIPESNIGINGRDFCVGDTVRLSATDYNEQGSFLRWDWDFDGLGTSTSQNPSFIATQAGTFRISVEYEEVGTGCMATTFVDIRVADVPTASFTADVGNTLDLCFNDLVEFYNTSPTGSSTTSSEWDFGGLGNFVGDTAQFIFPRGTYDVSLTVTEAAGCSDTETITYNFVGPDGDITSDLDAICFGDDMTFTLSNLTSDVTNIEWNLGDGTTASNVNQVTHTYNTPLDSSSTFVSAVLSSADNNCETLVSLPVNILQTEASFLPDSNTVFCPNDQIVFTNTSTDANTYEWIFGVDDRTMLENPIRTYATRDTYDITLIASIDSLGCIDTIEQPIIISQPPIGLDVSPSCEGDTAIVVIQSFDPTINYVIRPASVDATVLPNGTIAVANLTAATELTVTAQDNSACEAQETITIPVIPTLEDQVIDIAAWAGDVVTLPVDPSVLAIADEFDVNVDPSAMPNLSCTNCLDITFVDGITWRDTLVTVNLGSVCSDPEITYRIAVTGCEFYPTLFSPDGSMANDIFNFATPSGARRVITIEDFQIYDRWGTLVYNNESTRGWDGNFNGQEAPADVYSWFSVISLPSGETRTCKGNITLVR